MYNSLLNLFNFIVLNVCTPIKNSITKSTIFSYIKDFLNIAFDSIFRLFNNENNGFSNFFAGGKFAGVIGDIFGLLFLIFILKITISIFNVIFNTINALIFLREFL